MNIKHIPYNISDKENIIDLLNYNFDQFFANSYGVPGSVGAGGAVGGVGATGATGAIGLGGSTGPQGAVGNDGNLQWAEDTTTLANVDVVIPKAITSYSTRAALVIGKSALVATDDDSQLTIDSYSSSTSDSLQTYSSHIQLTNPGSPTYFDIKLNIDTLELAFNGLATNNVLKFNTDDGVTFADNAGNDIAVFDNNNGSTIYEDIYFQDSVNINHGFDIAGGTDTFLVQSSDNDGTFSSVDSNTLGTGVMVGTIIAIDKWQFNDTNFHTSDSPTVVTLGNGSIENYETKLGRGKNGTEWEGWYYCHGYTWATTHALGGEAYNTPDMVTKTFNSSTAGPLIQDDQIKRVIGAQGGSIYQANTSTNLWKMNRFNKDGVLTKLQASTVDDFNHGQKEIYHVAMDYVMYLGRDDLTWRITDVDDAEGLRANGPGGFNYANPNATSVNWNTSSLAWHWWESLEDNAFFNNTNINCCGTADGTCTSGNASGSFWWGGGWLPQLNKIPFQLYREYNYNIFNNNLSTLGASQGVLYMSAGRMAPTGYYRVPEDSGNVFNGVSGFEYCLLDWNLETCTLTKTWC